MGLATAGSALSPCQALLQTFGQTSCKRHNKNTRKRVETLPHAWPTTFCLKPRGVPCTCRECTEYSSYSHGSTIYNKHAGTIAWYADIPLAVEYDSTKPLAADHTSMYSRVQPSAQGLDALAIKRTIETKILRVLLLHKILYNNALPKPCCSSGEPRTSSGASVTPNLLHAPTRFLSRQIYGQIDKGGRLVVRVSKVLHFNFRAHTHTHTNILVRYNQIVQHVTYNSTALLYLVCKNEAQKFEVLSHRHR